VSPLKAYYVERNRWLLVWKTFPWKMLWPAPFHTAARYFWHVVSLRGQSSAAAQYVRQGNSGLDLVLIPIRALFGFLPLFAHGWKERRRIRRRTRIGAAEFERICRAHSITPKEVAEL
jgi:hypothetical protein